jgi:hypothetical protein
VFIFYDALPWDRRIAIVRRLLFSERIALALIAFKPAGPLRAMSSADQKLQKGANTP